MLIRNVSNRETTRHVFQAPIVCVFALVLVTLSVTNHKLILATGYWLHLYPLLEVLETIKLFLFKFDFNLSCFQGQGDYAHAIKHTKQA